MHELAFAESVIQEVLEEAERRSLPRVVQVALRVGVLHTVDPQALEFGFHVLTAGTILNGARLVVESIPIEGECRSCGACFVVHDFQFVCPRCGGGNIQVTHGDELEIAHLEVEEPCCGTHGSSGDSKQEVATGDATR